MNDIVLVRKDELYHYGVKGMKWGVRRYDKQELKSEYRSSVRKARKTYRKSDKGDKATAKYDAAKQAAKDQYKSKRKERLTIKESVERRDARVKKEAEKYGLLGTVSTGVSGHYNYSKHNAMRSMLANALNTSANLYINSSAGSYAAKRGVDYVRRAGIGALSLQDNAEKIMYYRDIYNSLAAASRRNRK